MSNIATDLAISLVAAFDLPSECRERIEQHVNHLIDCQQFENQYPCAIVGRGQSAIAINNINSSTGEQAP